MRTQIPLGDGNKDYNSRLSRTNLINGYIEYSNDGKFKRLRRANGLREFVTVGDGPIRGMFSIRGLLFVVSGSEWYMLDNISPPVLLGPVGGINELVQINAIGTDNIQVMVVSDGDGYTWDSVNGFLPITDGVFTAEFADYSVASLNQIFWVNKENSNIFGGSATGDGQVWPASRFASAEQNPDDIQFVLAKQSGLWLLGNKTVEPWQTNPSNNLIPVRPIAGGTIQRGVSAQKSVAQWQDSFFWLADDFTVWMVTGSSAQKISDLNLEYAIRGDGQKEPYVSPETAEGFFIDHPIQKLYVLTFPNNNITWAYDVRTKQWHIRESAQVGRWRVNSSELAFDKVLLGDHRTGQIFEWSESEFTEDGDTMSFEIVTPSIRSTEADLYISHIEMIMEVGVGGNGDPPPLMQIKYSRDGGKTFKSKEDVAFGAQGDHQTKVIRRQFGRTKRSFDFVLKFIITDPVPIYIYELFADVRKGI